MEVGPYVNFSEANVTSFQNISVSTQVPEERTAPSFEEHSIVEVYPWTKSYIDSDWVGRCLTTVILTFGTFGNVMTIIILHRMQSGWSAINMYLIALAVSDNAMLFTGVLQTWFRKVVDYDLYASHVIACKSIVWVLNVAASLSAWLLVCMTVQRTMSVVWPHRINVICTKSMTRVVIGGVTVIMMALYSHILFRLELVHVGNSTVPKCTFNSLEYQEFWGTVWVKIDMQVYAVLPSAILIISNGVLVWKLAYSVKAMRETFASARQSDIGQRKRKASSTTTTVIVVSLTFVLLTIPYMSYNAFFRLAIFENEDSRAFHKFLYECCFTFGLFNFAVNFYLYCLTGTKFRREFVKIIRSCCSCCKRRSNTEILSSGTKGNSTRLHLNMRNHFAVGVTSADSDEF